MDVVLAIQWRTVVPVVAVPRMPFVAAMASQTSSPVNRLPNELLAEIFALTLPEPEEGDATRIKQDSMQTIPPRNLLRVCRRWRDVVSSTPKLWSQWALYYDEEFENKLEKLMHFLLSGSSFQVCIPIQSAGPFEDKG